MRFGLGLGFKFGLELIRYIGLGFVHWSGRCMGQRFVLAAGGVLQLILVSFQGGDGEI